MSGLIFEIGFEEMPARFIPPAVRELKDLARAELAQNALSHGEIRTFATPRRLALMVLDLAEGQADQETEVLGPPAKAAYDANGEPTKAALGFAKSQGIELSDLKEMPSDKGPRLGYVRFTPGRPTAEVLGELLPRLVGKLSFPKTMRWGSEKFRFARPIHWFLALLDGQVVPFKLAGIKSGATSRGHRFLHPGPVAVSGTDDYLDNLRQAFVIADCLERERITRQEVARAASEAEAKLVPDEGLLIENANLVEYPIASWGGFDREFLEVPRAVVISAMREHQRYFSLEDEAGNLLPGFIAVNNTKAKDMAVVTQGHQRVLRARLADARFFLEEDRRRPLISRLDALGEVTYHAKLGSSLDKVRRFGALAVYLAGAMAPELEGKVARAADLAKCDLITEMVGEFPTLQGVVGQEYALRDGEDPEVAEAIAEHYMPVGAEGALPGHMVGALVGLGDRLDTICGCFGVGLIPSGAADPYGLRRAAIAVLRLATETGLRLSLGAALDKALELLSPWADRPADEVKAEVLQFFAARFQGLMAERGIPTDVAQAVLAVGLDDPAATLARAEALAQVKDSPEFAPLAAGLKRVMNILKKEQAQAPDAAPSMDLMSEEAEKALHQAYQALAQEARDLLAAGDYRSFLQKVSALKEPIDGFFDNVMVMVDDDKVRANRLSLLAQIAGAFAQMAEFTYLQLV